jgi:hypothetical protein
MARPKSEITHIREIITQRGPAGVTMGPSMVFRWERRPVPSGTAGVFVDNKMLVLQQAWVDTQGGVHWLDVPTIEAA